MSDFVPPFTDPEKARSAGDIGRATQAALRLLSKDAAGQGLPDEPYPRMQVIELRADIERVRAKLRATEDGREIIWLTAALTKLLEAERQAAGRPLPGTLRPQPPRAKVPAFSDPD